MYEKIGQMVRYYRKKQGLTLHGLAAKAGVGKTVIFDVEHGKPTVRLNILLKLLKALDIKLSFKTGTMTIDFKEAELVD